MRKKVKKAKEEIKKKTKSFWGEFKSFISRGNIIDLAIAVVIGGAFGKIVTSLVNSIITPLTSLFLKTGDISDLKWVIKPETTGEGGAVIPEIAVTYGLFLQAILDFIIISFVIFIALKIVLTINNRVHAKKIAEEKIKEQQEAEKKKAEEEAAALRAKEQEEILRQYYQNVAEQTKTLNEIKEILTKTNNT
jgi:large conductance mechanosensitive channel